jgi:predicted  nucleic acid-binding Zn-ribbon protein
MRELATKIIKKVSLEVIYEAIEERTGEIKADIAGIKSKQEEDFRYLLQRIDDMGKRIDDLGGRIDSLGGRIDTMMQMLMEISKQLLEISKQKS